VAFEVKPEASSFRPFRQSMRKRQSRAEAGGSTGTGRTGPTGNAAAVVALNQAVGLSFDALKLPLALTLS
jgi:hypothetical protein